MSTGSNPLSDATADPGYTLWAVLRRDAGSADARRPNVAEPIGEPLADAVRSVEEAGVTVRGFYDVSGLRADADLMVWLTGHDRRGTAARAPHPAPQRRARSRFSRPGTRSACTARPSSAAATLRRSCAGLPPKQWVTVYPFVRSYEWYLLPEDERRTMLADHGRAGGAYPQVQTNTVASFALGDYEWILALEADDPLDLVDLMRHLRAHRSAQARARRGSLLHRSARRASTRSPRSWHDRRAPSRVLVRDGCRGIRRRARRDARRLRRDRAGGLRRTRGAGRRHPLPAQRDARPRHPRRAARRGRPPLPALRRA